MTTTAPPADSREPRRRPALLDRRALNLPNCITVTRFVLAVILFVLIDASGWWRTSAVLFVIAAMTDFLDGYLARKYGQVTVLGRILDPFVDKIIICGAFIFLQGKTDGDLSSGVTGWMTFVIVARELFITSLRALVEQHGKDFSAKWSGKIKMALQCAAVLLCLFSLSRPVMEGLSAVGLTATSFDLIRDVTLWGTVAITIYSGIEYVIRAVRMWDA